MTAEVDKEIGREGFSHVLNSGREGPRLLGPLGASVLGPAVASAFDKIAGLLSRDALTLLDAMKETVGVRMLGA